MSLLEIPLSYTEKGTRLIEIVESCMQDIACSGWIFEKKDAQTRHRFPPYWQSFTVRSSGCWQNLRGGVGKTRRKPNEVEFDMYHAHLSHRSEKPKTLLCLRKYGGKGRKSIIDWIRNGAALEEESFVTDDSIFTLICPEESYSNLNFYANASFDPDKINESGQVKQIDSPQYKKIEQAYKQLEQKIIQRLQHARTSVSCYR
jgi:hypothetical protein